MCRTGFDIVEQGTAEGGALAARVPRDPFDSLEKQLHYRIRKLEKVVSTQNATITKHEEELQKLKEQKDNLNLNVLFDVLFAILTSIFMTLYGIQDGLFRSMQRLGLMMQQLVSELMRIRKIIEIMEAYINQRINYMEAKIDLLETKKAHGNVEARTTLLPAHAAMTPENNKVFARRKVRLSEATTTAASPSAESAAAPSIDESHNGSPAASHRIASHRRSAK